MQGNDFILHWVTFKYFVVKTLNWRKVLSRTLHILVRVLSGWITLLYVTFLYGSDAAADVDAYVFGEMPVPSRPFYSAQSICARK